MQARYGAFVAGRFTANKNRTKVRFYF
jgi:hypothetical protein